MKSNKNVTDPPPPKKINLDFNKGINLENGIGIKTNNKCINT